MEKKKHTSISPAVRIEMDFNSNDIDIKGFINDDKTLNVDVIQKQIKEELFLSYQKTLQWQCLAILKASPTD